MKRVFLIVLDSLGVGYAPDAADFGDVGSNTMRTISRSPKFRIPNLLAAGLGEMDGLDYLPRSARPTAAVARMREASRGKDTTIGHWEIAGIRSDKALPTYPQGFPPEILAALTAATGRGILCNRPYSGTEVIKDYGREHVATGKLIVYTSADSVLQIAAHEAVIPPEQLYDICRAARRIMTGPNAVGRIIARPFEGEWPYSRTTRRHDFSLEPPAETLLDAVKAAGEDVIAVGKIHDIFAARGMTETIYTAGNADGMEKTLALADRDFRGLCFVNLVDFDMLYGHRNDIDGYAAALSAFDAWLPGFLAKLGPDDCVLLTADHGCDPGYPTTDHTREYTPMVLLGEKIRPVSLGTRPTFSDIGATAAEFLGAKLPTHGTSFAADVLRSEP